MIIFWLSHPYIFSSLIFLIFGKLLGQFSKWQSVQSKLVKHWKPACHAVLLLVSFGVIVISKWSGSAGLLLVSKLVKVRTLFIVLFPDFFYLIRH